MFGELDKTIKVSVEGLEVTLDDDLCVEKVSVKKVSITAPEAVTKALEKLALPLAALYPHGAHNDD